MVNKELEKFASHLIETQSIAFIGSIDADGFPSVRAMLRPRRWDGIRSIYFSTNTPTNKVRHFLRNPKACVYICDAINFQGALLKGHMEVLTDEKHKKMFWQEGDEMYYPKGVTDENYCILHFTCVAGRCYDNLGSKEFTL